MNKEILPPCHTEDGGLFSEFDNLGYDYLVTRAGHPDGPGISMVECKREDCGVGAVIDPTDAEFDRITKANLCARALAPFCKLLKNQ